MGLGSELEHADRFAAYANELAKVIGHADREVPGVRFGDAQRESDSHHRRARGATVGAVVLAR
jgi:hypothetical protein